MLQCGIRLMLVHIASLAATILSVASASLCMSRLNGVRLFSGTLVEPGLWRILFCLLIPAGKDAIKVIRQPHIIPQNGSCVGVVLHVLAKLFSVFEDIMNKPTQKHDIAARAEWDPDVRHGRSARESRIDVNDRSAPLTRFDDPLESYRMVFSH